MKISVNVLVRLASAGLVLAALSGCNKLDKGAVEQTVMQSMASKGHTMKSVSCPDGLEFKEQTVACSAVDAAGKSLEVKVTIKPTSGGKADIRYVAMIDGKQISN